MNQIIKHIIIAGCLLFSIGVFGSDSNAQSRFGNLQNVEGLSIYVDSLNSFQLTDVNRSANLFHNVDKILLPANEVIWIQFTLDSTAIDKSGFIVIDQTQIDYFEWYGVQEGQVVLSDTGGIIFDFTKRNQPFTNWVFDISSLSNNQSTFYLKIKNSKSIFIDIDKGAYAEVVKKQTLLNSVFSVFVGIFLVMALYNTFIYFGTKERSYLIYVFHTIFAGLTQVAIFGYGFNFFWPNYPGFQQISVELLSSIVSVVGLEFLKEFLQTKKFIPKIHRVINLWIIGYLVIVLCSIFYSDIAYQILLISQPIVAVFVIYTAVSVYLKGYRPAKFYLVAWGMLMVGLTIYALAEQGIIVRNVITTLMMPIGSALEVILLSIALADNINSLKIGQERAIANTLRLEKEKATLILEQNIDLERKVSSRTSELEDANEVLGERNQEIKAAYSDLKNTQSQLVNAEKMSSLGQLTAGIAHEINNPINFVSSNISPLRRDIQDVISVFEETENVVGEWLNEEQKEKLTSLKEEYDYDYVKTEISQLLDGMDDGANRTVEIIRGLKLFSRVDEDDLKSVNLEEGIASTLILLNSSHKHKIKVTKNFGQIPPVECFGGKMNQVFMNIISNAGHALINDSETEDGEITITTTSDSDNVILKFSDNGPGMTDVTKEKLFEPFFTTKPVGEGTGLGLSIVYKIIENLNGTITVNSELGKGTEFIITLPITNTTKQPTNE